MKLPNEVSFIPGYYLITWLNGHGIVIEDPEYDHSLNIVTGKKVAVDGLDDDGGKIFIGMDDVKVFEPISMPKLEQVKTTGSAKDMMLRVQAQIELAMVVAKGREMKVVQGGQEPVPAQPKPKRKGTVGPIRAVGPATDGSGKIAPPSR